MTTRTTRKQARRSAAAEKTADNEDSAEHPDRAPGHRQRNRPSRGGETTKITGTDAAAQDQLKQELNDYADTVAKPNKRKRNVDDDHGASAVAAEDGRSYWLMKAEQEDREVQTHSGKMINTKFTIDDLQSRVEPEPWDGVRNLVARNNMRAMKKGDLAFFYASGGSGKNKPGITGIMEIVQEHEADFTMADEDAYGYVEPAKRGSSEKPQWSLVRVKFRQKLDEPVTLKRLQEYAAPGKELAGMQVLTHSRISVSKVTQSQWDFIVTNLIGKE